MMAGMIESSAERRLYDALERWDANPRYDVIRIACNALVDGLDSPSLRDLAGASVHDSVPEIRELVTKSLEELGIPYPGPLPPGFVMTARGIERRPEIDILRLAVTPETAPGGEGFQVEVYVNEIEMTSAGAGLGMDPFDLLIPVNRLAGEGTIPIARCDCGVYGCGVTDVTITREGEWVHWDWLVETPMDRGVSFAAAQYDAEVARMAADHTWETPERTAARRRICLQSLARGAVTPSLIAGESQDPAG